MSCFMNKCSVDSRRYLEITFLIPLLVRNPGEPIQTCENTDNRAVDSNGYGCSAYDPRAHYCGCCDDDDFVASIMCCACGGGEDSTI